MQQVYINALWLRPPTVFGRRLRPLSLGHAYLLEAIESPCIMSPHLASRHDVLAAVWICAQPWRRARCSLRGVIAGRGRWRFVLWGAIRRHADWDTEVRRFIEYVQSYTTTPARNRSTDKRDGSTRVPWPLAVAYAAGARSFDHQVWDLPLPEVFAYHAAGCAYAGDKTLKTDYELELDRQFAEEDASGQS